MLNNVMGLVGAHARPQLDVDLDVVGWNVVAGRCGLIWCGVVGAICEWLVLGDASTVL
jgi:hypothetical protein